jgi:LysR family glycine cleavage system transcriptional activator
MKRPALPLNALRAFEAAARHLSFSRAADELGVTHSAVSHHVKALEERLGIALFKRLNRAVRLTDAGHMLLPVLSESFDHIAESLDGLTGGGGRRALTVTLTPSFASKWLVPRLGRFRALHPEIDVRLAPSLDFADLTREGYDVAVRCGDGHWPGNRVDPLLAITMTPVCRPETVEDGLKTPADLARYTLIHADIGGEAHIGTEWRMWLDEFGIGDGGDLDRGISLPDPAMALQAAVDGLGVAMGYDLLAASDLAAGRLVAPFGDGLRHPLAYYVVSPSGTANNPNITAFRDWISSEADR